MLYQASFVLVHDLLVYFFVPGNPKVGNSAARYLFCFPCLIRLDLSGTGFKVSALLPAYLFIICLSIHSSLPT